MAKKVDEQRLVGRFQCLWSERRLRSKNVSDTVHVIRVQQLTTTGELRYRLYLGHTELGWYAAPAVRSYILLVLFDQHVERIFECFGLVESTSMLYRFACFARRAACRFRGQCCAM